MPLGLYISVPFCRSKCSFCNFASGVFSRSAFSSYVDRICSDVAKAEATAREMGGEFDRRADSIYLGGGTPTVLDPAELIRIFATLRSTFDVALDAEVTVECAPGSLTPQMLEALLKCGVNRVSLGIQSFSDEETRAVGRLHTRAQTLDDIARLREAGITALNIDLIAGLPHQTEASWRRSLEETLTTGAPHVSVYMLEVDEDSRLGRELIAGGTRYHAHFVPDDDTTADYYNIACETLNGGGVTQYEISNFARARCESRHNLKYWTRQPYLGFGVDAHSMLFADPYEILRRDETPESSAPCLACAVDAEAVRFATSDVLENYIAGRPLSRTVVTRSMALEEEFFLGLRLTAGVDLVRFAARYGRDHIPQDAIAELIEGGLLEQQESAIRLTARGRLLSNEVFQRFLSPIES